VKAPGAVVFDVFGTLVDWYTSIGEHATRVAGRAGVTLDPGGFAAAWRERYRPSMDEVRSGRRPWTDLDQLQRESLPGVLAGFGVELNEPDREELVAGWHALRPWPGVPDALRELRKLLPVSTLSNGHVRLLIDLARHGDLSFDTLLSAEIVGGYKPDPVAYRTAAGLLGVPPEELLLVACHRHDLAGAKAAGLSTAYLPRPAEWGPDTPPRPVPDEADLVLDDLAELPAALS
jgi:2-haloacid dehalogenase